jgi:hypothetical protein
MGFQKFWVQKLLKVKAAPIAPTQLAANYPGEFPIE